MSVIESVAGLRAALARVVADCDDGELTALANGELMDVLREVETVRNTLSVVDQAWIRAADDRHLAAGLAARTTQNLLAMTLRLSNGDAKRRVRAATALSTRTTLLGAVLPPDRPALAEVQRAGAVSADQVDTVLKTLSYLDHCGRADVDDIAKAEVALVGYAEVFAPKDLHRLGQRIIDALFPDGTLAEDAAQRDLRELSIVPVRGGMYRISGQLTAEVGATMTAVLSPLAAPRPADPSGPDERTAGQRWHDALRDAMRKVLSAGELPDSGGTPATVIVTIDYQDLTNRTGLGVLSDGTLLPAAEVLRLADEALVIPSVLDSAGAVLDQGRDKRIATPAQTLALVARDGGCSFPGCDHPPDYCQRHHIRAWIDDGETDLDNLTLLCGYHHRTFEERGWTCRLSLDRLPEWVPPVWVDPEQRPMRNARVKGMRTLVLA